MSNDDSKSIIAAIANLLGYNFHINKRMIWLYFFLTGFGIAIGVNAALNSRRPFELQHLEDYQPFITKDITLVFTRDDPSLGGGIVYWWEGEDVYMRRVFALSDFPESQWIQADTKDGRLLPLLLRREGKRIFAKWLTF